MSRAGNGSAAASRCLFRGDEMACFDRLPPELRRALHEAVVKWSALETRWFLNRRLKRGETKEEAVAMELEGISDAERREISAFGAALPRIFGGKSPHQRAGATIQRYGVRGPMPQGRRRRRWA